MPTDRTYFFGDVSMHQTGYWVKRGLAHLKKLLSALCELHSFELKL